MTDFAKLGAESTSRQVNERDKECLDIAVNGTLMRGLELEANLVNTGARFVREDYTERAYRLFSIDDIHPGMVRVPASGLEGIPVSVAVEIWCVPSSSVAKLLAKEPSGLSIGKINLRDGRSPILGVLAEPTLIVGKKDISDFPGDGIANFRSYIVHEGMRIVDEAMAQKPNLPANELATLWACRNTAQSLKNDCDLRSAVDLLNYCVKKLGLANRLFQNIPIRWTSSFRLIPKMNERR